MKINSVALVLSLFLNTTSWAGKGGSGGSIEEMRAATALSRIQMIQLLENNGEMLKAQVLIPAFERLVLSQIADNEIQTKLNLTIGPDKKEFVKNLVYMDFVINGCTCPYRAHACRIGGPYSTYTCFEVDNLVAVDTSFSELAGIAAHEVSRRRIPLRGPGSEWQDDNHQLAAFFEHLVNVGNYK